MQWSNRCVTFLTSHSPSIACSGFRERLLADPGFMIKVAIEVGIGICTKCTAEYTKRGDDFKSQVRDDCYTALLLHGQSICWNAHS